MMLRNHFYLQCGAFCSPAELAQNWTSLEKLPARQVKGMPARSGQVGFSTWNFSTEVDQNGSKNGLNEAKDLSKPQSTSFFGCTRCMPAQA